MLFCKLIIGFGGLFFAIKVSYMFCGTIYLKFGAPLFQFLEKINALITRSTPWTRVYNVLRVCAYTKVRPSIVKRIVVDVVNNLALRCTHYQSMHRNPLSTNCALRITISAVTPTIINQPPKILVINDCVFVLCEGDCFHSCMLLL